MLIVKLHVRRAPTLNVKLGLMLNVRQVLKLSFVADLVAADLVAYQDPAADLAVEEAMAAMADLVDTADMATEVAMEVAMVVVDVGARLTSVE